jgi:hypothetical protein
LPNIDEDLINNTEWFHNSQSKKLEETLKQK